MFDNQELLELVIISFILMTFLFKDGAGLFKDGAAWRNKMPVTLKVSGLTLGIAL